MATVSCRRKIRGDSRAPLKAGWGCGENFVEQHESRRVRPRAAIASRSAASPQQISAGPGIAQHRGQFRRRLAGVQRDGDQAFADNGQIERGPANAVRSDQRAAVALRKSRSAQKMRAPWRFARAVRP